MNRNKEIWEGWTVGMFIEDLDATVTMVMEGRAITNPFKTKKELAVFVTDNQPYYKKRIPEVINYFAEKYNLK